MERESSQLILPRGLIFVAFIWLVGSWARSVGLRPPLRPTAATYEPGIKILLVCLMIGLMIGWPLGRLSQRPVRWPLRQTLLDLIVLLSMLQVVIWPLRLITTWTRQRTTAMDLTMVFWSLLAGAVVAAAIGTHRAGVRSLAILVTIAMCLLAPTLAWLGVWGGLESKALVDMSPLLAIHSLGEGRGSEITAGEWRLIAVLGAASAAAWIALFLVRNRLVTQTGETPEEAIS